MTGASGAIYGVRLIQVMKKVDPDAEVHLVISETAKRVIRHEVEVNPDDLLKFVDRWYREDDMEAPIASGSFRFQSMAIVPCSMKTLASIASGITDNLIVRAADVALKERRRLVLVIREAPFNLIHIENMERVTRAGAIVMPASPGFYHKPKTIQDMVDFVVGRVLDLMGIEHRMIRRWGE
jgi:4-hydroxy-3-polyprenylbenzoate decarboxylase